MKLLEVEIKTCEIELENFRPDLGVGYLEYIFAKLIFCWTDLDYVVAKNFGIRCLYEASFKRK